MRKLGIILCLAAVVVGVVSIFRWNADSRQYCQLRFGSPDPHEIILVRTSHALLLFRSGQMDSKPEEYPLDDGHLPEGVTIPPIEHPNGSSYTIVSVSEYTDEETTRRHHLMLHVKIDGDTPFTQYCDVKLSDTSHDMKYAYFDGPLSVGPITINWEIPAGTKFVLGGDATDIRANVATLDKSGGCWTVVESGDDKLPDGVHPTVTVVFPTVESSTPIVRSFALDEFC